MTSASFNFKFFIVFYLNLIMSNLMKQINEFNESDLNHSY